VRVALLSDVHGNLPAFEAVIADVRSAGVDAIWNLGDLVGYGAQPDECVQLARETCDLCLIGNHDLVAIDKLSVDDFSANAATAALWTRDHIQDETRDFLMQLSPKDESHDMKLYHASPRDPVWEYVLDAASMTAALEDTVQPIVLVGHSHVPLTATVEEGQLRAAHAPGETEYQLGGRRVLLNPGSVGQPRDGDPRAAFVVLDLAEQHARFHRVEYDVVRTQKEIRNEGLPEPLAERLAHGL
jgi:diadenosine tetraphosphatase ApaH/serine/threonine PP2A family protein phosphatase